MKKENEFGNVRHLPIKNLDLPKFNKNFSGKNSIVSSVEGTNVIRVPFGKRFSKRPKPEKNQKIATLILPLSAYNSPTPPHVA